jgi:hypothetical protein
MSDRLDFILAAILCAAFVALAVLWVLPPLSMVSQW